MILPVPLKPGDKSIIIATAAAVTPNDAQYAQTILERWGLKVDFGKNLFEQKDQFSGTDQQRLYDLNNAVANSDYKAIFFARGGYGTTRILDQVDTKGLVNSPKWLVGFSDLTPMLNLCSKRGIATIHGPMPRLFKKTSDQALENLRRTLFGESLCYSVLKHPFNRKGIACGQLAGGNLAMIINSFKTCSEIDPTEKILFIEDTGEYYYQLDRMMVQLKRAGFLEEIAGIVVGAFTELEDNTTPFGKTAYEIISEHCANYQYPILFNFPAGHIKDNNPLVIGKKARIKVTESTNELVFL